MAEKESSSESSDEGKEKEVDEVPLKERVEPLVEESFLVVSKESDSSSSSESEAEEPKPEVEIHVVVTPERKSSSSSYSESTKEEESKEEVPPVVVGSRHKGKVI